MKKTDKGKFNQGKLPGRFFQLGFVLLLILCIS